MTLTITGASGQLGRRAAELLLDRDGVDPAQVVLVTRSPDMLSDLAARGAQVRHGDFKVSSTLGRAFEGATRVLLVSTREPGPARVAQHRAAIEAIRLSGAELVAYTSIPNPDPEHNVAAVVPDHAATERALVDSGVGYTFLRNALYSDFKVPEARAAISAGAFTYNSGDGVSAFVTREDCAAAAVAVLAGGDEHAGRAYDITGPQALSGADLAGLYGSLGNTTVDPVAMGDGPWLAEQVDHGVPEFFARMAVSFGQAIREGALDQLSDDVAQLTGRVPLSVRDLLVDAGVGAS